MNNADVFIHQSLAATGFAILDPSTAARLRGDLWRTNAGIAAAHDFAQAKDRVGAIEGVQRFLMRMAGRPDLTVLARDDRDLQQRVEWILGEPVLALFAEDAIAGVSAPIETPPRARPATSDRFAGISTAQPGRACGSCNHFTAGHACRKAAESGIEHPPARELRRCTAFAPQWDAYDTRTGVQLWPELVQPQADAGAAA